MKVKSFKIVKTKRLDSLPDIDTDFQTEDRDDVKRYLKKKYGELYTCSVGTYGRLQLRQTIKDLAKLDGLSFNETNLLTKGISNQTEYEFLDIFKYAISDERLYNFIQKYPKTIKNLEIILKNPRSTSIHASAVLILPKIDDEKRKRNIVNWLPVREIDGMLVSEWEGKYCDAFGLLKNDILGLNQLDKFTYCLRLIKENTGKKIDLDKIPLDDSRTYLRFRRGLNEDVFQFNGGGMKSYSKEVKPDHIEDICAMAALYRPGPMGSGAHHSYAEIKNGKKKPEYDWGMKEITKKTNGVWVYQEQVMAAFIRAGFTPVESDSARTMMKKFDRKGMEKLRKKFVKNISIEMSEKEGIKIEKAKEEAEKIFEKIYSFSLYGFNKSHSFAYALIAYHSQYLKANYPLEFWTTSLNFGDETKEIPKFIEEIKTTQKEIKGSKEIKVVGIDINRSSIRFECDKKNNEILWSLQKLKGVGAKVVEKLVERRNSVGEFQSLEHFLEVVPKKDCNKKAVTNLIVSGAFDKLENIESPKERLILLFQFYETMKHDFSNCPYMNDELNVYDFFWVLKEKELTGFGEINFHSLVEKTEELSRNLKYSYLKEDELKYRVGNIKNKFESVVVCGILKEVFEFGRKKEKHKKLVLEANSTRIECVIWSSVRKQIDVEKLVGGIVAISGRLDLINKERNTVFIDERSKIILV